jgi:peptidyl-dipeptidase Dcp
VLHAQNNSVKITLSLQKSTLQYQAPSFNLIKDKDFKPAFEYGLGVHNKEVMAIANPAKPSFQNTVLALEISGVDLKELQAFL